MRREDHGSTWPVIHWCPQRPYDTACGETVASCPQTSVSTLANCWKCIAQFREWYVQPTEDQGLIEDLPF